MYKYLLIPAGIIFSMLAQVILKKTTDFNYKQFSFFIYFFFAGFSYLISFVLYSIILKYFPISRISPVMTLGTMILVIIAGLFIFNESISLKQIIGIGLGIAAIFLLVK